MVWRSKPRSPAVEVAARAGEEEAAQEGQERVAEIAVQGRHRAEPDRAAKAVAHHQLTALAQLLDKSARSLKSSLSPMIR
jgi:hypothetical protein